MGNALLVVLVIVTAAPHQDRVPSAQFPVFPLPEMVLFPGIVLPLHVFEPRYRNLVADALAADAHVIIAMLRPGWQQQAVPAVAEVGCVARIIHADRLARGEYNILLQGVDRAELLEEAPPRGGYRRFVARLIPRATPASLVAARAELVELRSCVVALSRAVAQTDQQLLEVLRSTADPLELVDILAAVLVPDPLRQQALLATPDFRTRLVRLNETLAEAMVRLGPVPGARQLN